MIRIIVAVLLLIPAVSTGQDKDVFSLSHDLSSIKSNEASGYYQQWEVRAKYPVFKGKQVLWAGGCTWKQVSIKNIAELPGTTFNGLSAQVFRIQQIGASASFTVFAQAGMFTDWIGVSFNDLRYGIGFRYKRRHSDRLSSGWGLAYARQFFGHQLVPFVEIDYRPSGRWRITGHFPVKPRITYQVSKQFRLGMELQGDASSFRFGPSGEKSILQINQWSALIRAEQIFKKNWTLFAGAGVVIRQSYRVYDDPQAVPWTIITIPLGAKEEPLSNISGKGFCLQFGCSLNVF